jgi:hypothetical protein
MIDERLILKFATVPAHAGRRVRGYASSARSSATQRTHAGYSIFHIPWFQFPSRYAILFQGGEHLFGHYQVWIFREVRFPVLPRLSNHWLT